MNTASPALFVRLDLAAFCRPCTFPTPVALLGRLRQESAVPIPARILLAGPWLLSAQDCPQAVRGVLAMRVKSEEFAEHGNRVYLPLAD